MGSNLRRRIWIIGTVLSISAVALVIVDLVSFNKIVGFVAIAALVLGSLLTTTSRYSPLYRRKGSVR